MDIRVLDSLSDVMVRSAKGLAVSVSMLRRSACSAVSAVVRSASDLASSILLIGQDARVDVVGVDSKLSVSIAMVCSPDVGGFYLEIEPEMIWVYPDIENYNNVYSNTSWIIN